MNKTHVDLNKAPQEAEFKHAFFFCPKCGGLADTKHAACPSDKCEYPSVIAQMSCEKCDLAAEWTHWEIH